MLIKPKYTSIEKSTGSEVKKQFTDREEFIGAFENALLRNKQTEHSILVYYGIGGIGKTALRKELCRLLDGKYPQTVWCSLDFDLPAYREEETALYFLRNYFRKKYNIHFPTFEIAYAVYWQKTHPQIKFSKTDLSFIDEGGIVTDLVSITGGIPLIGLIPGITKTIMKSHSYLKDWWIKKGRRELYNLPQMEAKDIIDRLPMFFASDLIDYLKTTDKQCVIFMDTFEALWENIHSEGAYFTRDEWIRELVSQLPGVLWVICGREKLRWVEIDQDWKNCIEHFLIRGLSIKDSEYFLNSCNIKDKKITDIIVNSSKGMPYYLDLAADTYSLIKYRHNREPVEQDFARTQTELLDRFLKYLERTEIETLKILSSARLFNRELFELLVNEFKTGYPVTAFTQLCRFSFINEGLDKGFYSIHDLMRDSLQSKADRTIIERTCVVLFEYYNKKLAGLKAKDINDEHYHAIKEAFYFGKKSLDANEFCNWFFNICDTYEQIAKRSMMLPLFEEFLSMVEINFGNEHHQYIKGLHMLSLLYEYLGKYKEAEFHLIRSLTIEETLYGLDNINSVYASAQLGNIYRLEGKYSEAELQLNKAIVAGKKFLGFEHTDLAGWMNNLAILYYEKGKYSEAEPLFKKAIEIGAKTTGFENPKVVEWLNNLGTLYSDQARFSEADALLNKSLEISEKLFGFEHPEVANRLNNIALLNYSKGEFNRAESLFSRAIDIGIKTLGEGHPDLLKWSSNLSLVYYKQGKYSESEQLMKSILSDSEKILGDEHPSIAVYLNNLAGLYSKLGRFDNVEELLLRAIEISEQNYGTFHPELAVRYNNLAKFYFRQGKYTEAESSYKSAISISEKSVGIEHPDYAFWIKNLAVLYHKQLKYAESEILFKEAINTLEKSLGPEHSDLSEALCDISDLYFDQKRYDESELNYIRALAIREKAYGEIHPLVIEVLKRLSKNYELTGNISKSAETEDRIKQLESKTLNLQNSKKSNKL